MMTVDKTKLQDLTLFGSRLLIAFIFLWHGFPKAINPSMAIDKFIGFGLPGLLGPIIGIVEVVAAVALVIGVFHRWTNLLLAAVIAGAILTVQLPGGFTAGLERDLLILFGTLLLSLYGPGLWALENKHNDIARHATQPFPEVSSSQV